MEIELRVRKLREDVHALSSEIMLLRRRLVVVGAIAAVLGITVIGLVLPMLEQWSPW